MKIESRQYQVDCAKAWHEDIEADGINPVISAPTGCGKSIILCLTLQKYFKEHPHNRVLVLSHTKEIVQQDYEALIQFFPNLDVGIYSSGLKQKNIGQLTVGGIQSVANAPGKFFFTNLVIVDEVHSVSHKAEGRYRTLFKYMKSTIAGMSATIFRTGHGYIHKGEGVLFNKLSYDLSSLQSFNKLVEDGYLAPLIAVKTRTQLESSSIKITGGDFNKKELAAKHDREDITRAAIVEACHYGKKYKMWLVFAIDTNHADHVAEELNRQGITARALHTKMDDDRDQTILDFKAGKFRALVSVGMVTTGFDVKPIDLILLLRSTASPVLHVQMTGRGLRPAPGKEHTLILDYAGNFERLGPINDVILPKKHKSGGGEAVIKTCPECSTMVPPATRICPSCGHHFKFESHLSVTASDAEVIAKTSNKQKWLTVSDVRYSIHNKPGKPASLMLSYRCGTRLIKEWLCFDHQGVPGRIARHRAKQRGYKGPYSVYHAYVNRDQIKKPSKIYVDFSDKYPSIKAVRL